MRIANVLVSWPEGACSQVQQQNVREYPWMLGSYRRSEQHTTDPSSHNYYLITSSSACVSTHQKSCILSVFVARTLTTCSTVLSLHVKMPQFSVNLHSLVGCTCFFRLQRHGVVHARIWPHRALCFAGVSFKQWLSRLLSTLELRREASLLKSQSHSECRTLAVFLAECGVPVRLETVQVCGDAPRNHGMSCTTR